MFASILARCSEKIDWCSPMPGVKVWDFDAVLPAVPRPELLPGRYETLFCRSGTFCLYAKDGRSCCVQRGDILLISDVSRIRTVSFPRGRLQGTLVAVDAAGAAGSLARLCALLGRLELNTRQVGRQMAEAGGCACIRGELWSEALFLALAGLPAEERGKYCTLKAVELLYLMGSFDLSRTWQEPCGGQGQTELVRQVSDYIQTHLGEELTIGRLARQFHCSSTALKSAFRQSYGLPIHRHISACRLRRGAELLDATTFSVLRIASEVGYSSTSQFSAMFKRRYGYSPAQYRRRREKSETDDFST